MRNCTSKFFLSAALFTSIVAFTHIAKAENKQRETSPGQQQIVVSENQSSFHNNTDLSKWDIIVGLGAGVSPEYEGSDKYEATPLPFFEVLYNDVISISPEGIGINVYRDHGLNIYGGLGYDAGRGEDDSDYLQGLGDIDGMATANLRVEYEIGPISPYVNVTKQMGSTDGLLVKFGIESMVPLALLIGGMSQSEMEKIDNPLEAGTLFFVNVAADWVDDNYMSEYFGITSQQSINSGLSQYNTEAGFKSISAEVGTIYPLSKNWALNAQVGYSQLIGDAADSPIAKADGQVFGGVFLSYKF